MRAFRHSFWVALRGLLVPSLLACALCGLALGVLPPLDGMGADRAAGTWLYLPGIVLMLAAMATAVDGWPLFSRARQGADWLDRIAARPFHGCLAAAGGTLLGLALYLALAGCGFLVAAHWTRTELATPRDRIDVIAQSRTPHLDSAAAPKLFSVPRPRAASHLRLRTIGLLGPDTTPAEIQVRANGRCVHPEEPWIPTSGGMLELPLSDEPGQGIQRIEVRRRENRGLVLWIESDSVQLIGAVPRSLVGNAVLAMWSFLAPTLLGLAVMILGHRHLAMPVNLGAGAGIGILAVLFGWAPTAWIRAFARGASLWAEPLASDLVPTLVGSIALLVLAAVAGARS